MAQHDYTIANQGFPATRADINNALSAIATNNSGTSAPSTQYAGQFWIDTTTTTWTLYIHDGTDDIQFATIDTSANTINFTDSALDVVTDTTPQLGGNLDVNGNQIVSVSNGDIVIAPNGTGKVDINGNLDVDGGTIKLDGNYPVGTFNTAFGDLALDDASLTGGCNVAIGRQALSNNTTGVLNVAVGYQAGLCNTSGTGLTAFGTCALANNTTASSNTGIGASALNGNTTGANNTAIGNVSLLANTTGASNTAVGQNSLRCNTTASNNTAVGYQSLCANTTGASNTAVGMSALQCNTTASNNTAVGYGSLFANTTGTSNVALGRSALQANTTANNNTAVGYSSLYDNTTGASNVALGFESLSNNTTASNNTAVGFCSLNANTTGPDNVAVGYLALCANSTGCRNVAIGRNAGCSNTSGIENVTAGYYAGYSITTGARNTILGTQGSNTLSTGDNNHTLGDNIDYGEIFNLTTESNRVIIGNNTTSNAYVKVAWTVTSDQRDKTNFGTVPHGLDFVTKLKPVSFQFKKSREDDTPTGTKHYGFLAQDILELEGDNNVIIDNEQPEKLKYKGEHLVPVLVNAIKDLKKEIDILKNK